MKTKMMMLAIVLASTCAFAKPNACNSLVSTANAIYEVKNASIGGIRGNYKAAEMPSPIEKNGIQYKTVVVTFHLSMPENSLETDIASLVLLDPSSCEVFRSEGKMLHADPNP